MFCFDTVLDNDFDIDGRLDRNGSKTVYFLIMMGDDTLGDG